MILCISKQMFEYHTFWNGELDKIKKNSQSFHIGITVSKQKILKKYDRWADSESEILRASPIPKIFLMIIRAYNSTSFA